VWLITQPLEKGEAPGTPTMRPQEGQGERSTSPLHLVPIAAEKKKVEPLIAQGSDLAEETGSRRRIFNCDIQL